MNNSINDDIVNDILSNNLIEKDILLNGYILVIDGKIYIDSKGKFIFNDEHEITRSFYNAFSWKAKYEIYKREHQTEDERIADWSEYATYRTINWGRFKKAIKDNHNYTVIKLNGRK